MCCMNSSGLAASEESAAGYWGDYRVHQLLCFHFYMEGFLWLAACQFSSWYWNRGVEHVWVGKMSFWNTSLQCDVPVWTIQHMLENIRDQHGSEIDYIMVNMMKIAVMIGDEYVSADDYIFQITGDFPPHDVWKQSRDSNLMRCHSDPFQSIPIHQYWHYLQTMIKFSMLASQKLHLFADHLHCLSGKKS